MERGDRGFASIYFELSLVDSLQSQVCPWCVIVGGVREAGKACLPGGRDRESIVSAYGPIPFTLTNSLFFPKEVRVI